MNADQLFMPVWLSSFETLPSAHAMKTSSSWITGAVSTSFWPTVLTHRLAPRSCPWTETFQSAPLW